MMPKVNRKMIKVILATVVLMVVASMVRSWAQTGNAARGKATYIGYADLMATAKKSADKPINDTQVAVVDVNNGEYHLAIGIAHRSKASVSTPGGGGVEHSDITEVYHIISGNAILETGGTIKDLKQPNPSGPNGPSGPTASGGEIMNGVTQAVGPGDIVVIPPNTPHRFSEITSDEIVYVLMRPDPHKVLPVMNLLAK
jgi:mannose-6-phosphate isomerase-like protein (cupin superfamily)